jgi:hypothetical protein
MQGTGYRCKDYDTGNVAYGNSWNGMLTPVREPGQRALATEYGPLKSQNEAQRAITARLLSN